MRAKLGCKQIDDALPIRIFFSPEAEGGHRIAWRTAVTENSRALLTADGDGLMPLDGAQIIWDRGGHLIELRKNFFRGTISEVSALPTLAADTQSAVTSLRETVSHDVSIEG